MSPLEHYLLHIRKIIRVNYYKYSQFIFCLFAFVAQIHTVPSLHLEICNLHWRALISISTLPGKVMNRFLSRRWNLFNVLEQSHYINRLVILASLVAPLFLLCGSSLCIPASGRIANSLERSTACPHLALQFPHHLTPVGNLPR